MMAHEDTMIFDRNDDMMTVSRDAANEILHLRATLRTTQKLMAMNQQLAASIMEFCEHHGFEEEDVLDWIAENPDGTATCEYCGGYLVAHEGTVTKGMHTDCYNDLKAEKLNG
jgi:hypothetical protein